ncbi:hypothetical protein, partial [Lactiplantibacillus plantarum]|uniref:hypothetical protein n=1 Tax=Lactiplantibacillus plantarum TaxID=1590 RepID=UPI003F52DD7D
LKNYLLNIRTHVRVDGLILAQKNKKTNFCRIIFEQKRSSRKMGRSSKLYIFKGPFLQNHPSKTLKE